VYRVFDRAPRLRSAAELAIDVVPMAMLAYEAADFMLTLRTTTTEPKASDKFHGGMVIVDAMVLTNLQAQPGGRRLLCSQP